jgi:hypothetical protein
MSRARRHAVILSAAKNLLFLGAVGFLAACGDSSTAPKTPDGNYALATVNGGRVPYTMYADGAYRQEITSGTLVLAVDGKYVARTTTTDFITGVTPQVYQDSTYGTWLRDAATISFTDAIDKSVTTGTWKSDSLIIVQGTGTTATTIVYTR